MHRTDAVLRQHREMCLDAIELVGDRTRIRFIAKHEIENGAERLTREANGGLLVPRAIFTVADRELMVGLAARYHLPAVYMQRAFISSGGLMSYGTDLADLASRAAIYVDKILKGVKPADMPIEQPTKFELVINSKTARVTGASLPPALLARADEVIE